MPRYAQISAIDSQRSLIVIPKLSLNGLNGLNRTAGRIYGVLS